jgi:hypothetical protein
MGSGVGAVIRRLRARRGEIESAIFAGMRDVAFGSVGAQDAEYLAELRAAVAAAVDYVLEGIERGALQGAACSSQQRLAQRVRGLLDGEAVEHAGLDYELGGWHLGVIAVGTDAARAVLALAERVDRRLLSVVQGEQGVWAWLGGGERFAAGEVELLAASMDGMGSPAGGDLVLALGEPARGVEGWRLTHRQAQAALVVALRRPPGCTRYADVALLATALKDQALASALIEIYIAPLEDGRGGGPVLRETLRAYLAAERNISSTAAALGVVRKTVDTRLRTIEERLGRTLHPCPAELEIALELEQIAAEPPEPPGPPQPPGPPEISTAG